MHLIGRILSTIRRGEFLIVNITFTMGWDFGECFRKNTVKLNDYRTHAHSLFAAGGIHEKKY